MIIDSKEKDINCTVVKGLDVINQKSKLVESYFVFKYDSGIYMVMFNTVDRWINYFLADDNIYMFSNEFDKQLEDYVNFETIEIEEFLPKDIHFVRTKSQNKDQVYFYFIPFNLIKDEN